LDPITVEKLFSISYSIWKSVLDESMMGDSLELKTNFWRSNATQIPYGRMFSPSRWAELLPDLFSSKIKFNLKCNVCDNTWIKETLFPGSTLWHCNSFTISEEYDNDDPWPIMPAFMRHQCDKCKEKQPCHEALFLHLILLSKK
jgi:ribosomal protein S27E